MAARLPHKRVLLKLSLRRGTKKFPMMGLYIYLTFLRILMTRGMERKILCIKNLKIHARTFPSLCGLVGLSQIE